VLRATEASAMTFEIFSSHISLSSLREASLFGLSCLAGANSHIYMQYRYTDLFSVTNLGILSCRENRTVSSQDAPDQFFVVI
jgi:hypothetical protein